MHVTCSYNISTSAVDCSAADLLDLLIFAILKKHLPKKAITQYEVALLDTAGRGGTPIPSCAVLSGNYIVFVRYLQTKFSHSLA